MLTRYPCIWVYVNGLKIRSQTVDPQIYDSILSRVHDTWPGLQISEAKQHSYGFRPYRDGGVRIEGEIIKANDEFGSVRDVILIHNYGHGAAGKFNRQGICYYM